MYYNAITLEEYCMACCILFAGEEAPSPQAICHYGWTFIFNYSIPWSVTHALLSTEHHAVSFLFEVNKQQIYKQPAPKMLTISWNAHKLLLIASNYLQAHEILTTSWNVHNLMKYSQPHEMFTTLQNAHSIPKSYENLTNPWNVRYFKMLTTSWNTHNLIKCSQSHEMLTTFQNAYNLIGRGREWTGRGGGRG